jgi:hypothetical protein
MEYIQKLFLDIGRIVENITVSDELFSILDTEPPEFRSIAYESASFEIALRDLKTGQSLNNWLHFRLACAQQHPFHIDIGLGWAFAKAGMQPGIEAEFMRPALKEMLYDGFGYYFGLFKGRNTLKNKVVPKGIEGESLNGFDQGLGRRLWYMARGQVDNAIGLIANFPEARHPDLWRGIGIACGYVGGNDEDDLKCLSTGSGKHLKQFQTGIKLAAMSRIASGSVNEDVEKACRIVCNKAVQELNVAEDGMTNNLF